MTGIREDWHNAHRSVKREALMWRRIVFLMLAVWLTAGTICSCADRPRPGPRDLFEERYQEQQLQKVIRQQSG